MEYQLNIPYPKARVEAKNIYYGQLLLEDYASTISEETAIHLYFYQALITKEKDPVLAKVLHEIAITEMHHLQLLGETIHLLGVDPKYRTINSYTKEDCFWKASYVPYEKDIIDLLKIDIQAEEEAIRHYQSHRNQISDIYVKNLLTRIIEDERLHLQIFHDFLYKIETKRNKS